MVRPAGTIVAIAVVASTLGLLTGCPLAECTMEETEWRLVGWSVSSIDPAKVLITATFADGQASGSGGVNRYHGPYTLGPGNAFASGPLAATKMAGPEPAMRAETAFFTLLGQAASYRCSKGRLTLYDKGGNESLIFEAVKQQSPVVPRCAPPSMTEQPTIRDQERGDVMYYIVETKKPFEQATADLEAAVRQHGFSVLHTHDLGRTLRSKGIPFAEECRVLEVCNPMQAAKVMSTDMRLNMALPCRISVFTEKGKTQIGLIKPMQVLSALSQDPALVDVANEVEQQTIQMVNDAR